MVVGRSVSSPVVAVAGAWGLKTSHRCGPQSGVTSPVGAVACAVGVLPVPLCLRSSLRSRRAACPSGRSLGKRGRLLLVTIL